MNEFYRDIWEQAQVIAKENYEEEWGEGSWEDADKYEREDWVFDIYNKLAEEKERKEMCGRDPKTGRFVSTKANGNNETTNTNSIKKENDTMMNRNNAKENRMDKLAQAGVDTTNFFDLSLRIPFGAEVRLSVDGKEMVIPATNGTFTTECVKADDYNIKGSIGLTYNDIANSLITAAHADLDPIAQSIVNDGYVKNSKLFRRFILAHTFKLLEYVDRKDSRRKGWEAGFKDLYGYGYQFEMLADELHTLAKLQKEDPEYFAERTRFFNGDVVVATLNDYLYRLRKYVNKQLRINPKKYRGQAYCKLARYGNVLVKDLDTKVFYPIEFGIDNVKKTVASGDYSKIEKAFKEFMAKYYNKLPYETPKCATFKDAYKGIGSFESLKNLIRFHEVVLDGCDNKYDSERELYRILKNTPNSEVWRFHNLLVSTIELNKFDLRKSIMLGNAAPNTTSEKADRYRR